MSAGEWLLLAGCVFYGLLALALFAANHSTSRARRPFRLDGELQHLHRDTP